MNHITCHGSFRVALPPERARELFTPEGERTWAQGWDPAYPGGHRRVFTTPGTVWFDLAHLRYARVTAVDAGTVEVRCEPDGDATRAHVTYDLTALSPDADLDAFAAGYDAYMATWERDIAAAL